MFCILLLLHTLCAGKDLQKQTYTRSKVVASLSRKSAVAGIVNIQNARCYVVREVAR